MLRVNLPVVQEAPKAGHVSCLQCAKCCTYVAVGINAPTTPKLATEILWHLYHHGVSVCRDEAGEWYVQFEARCKNLGEGNLCAVYLNRPHICRAYDDQTCEVNAPQAGLIQFKEPQPFLEYLSRKKPKIYRAIEKKYVPPEHRLAAPALKKRRTGGKRA
ncbi:MAG: YkgJ family cysteine cluster protein [Vicinamibacteria bacterium]|nr:YkgJ family cysteine cluster protein [Vicinamibacteria bacterium]